MIKNYFKYIDFISQSPKFEWTESSTERNTPMTIIDGGIWVAMLQV